MSRAGIERPASSASSIPEKDVTLMGVRFHRLRQESTVELMAGAFGHGEALKVYIANAHTLNLAWTDLDYRRILNQADLLLNDGVGVQLGSWMCGKPFPENLVGTDLTPMLCQRAAQRGIGVFVLGGIPGLAERAAERLQALAPGLRIAGTHHGYFSPADEAMVRDEINESGAGILLVAFGNPLQETWIHRNADFLRCDLCVGIGGLIDHLGGRLHRAPSWVRKARLEWMHILMNQPHKWRRYVLGNPLFLIRALRARLGLGP